MKIGEASRQSGISAKMIRYYEGRGLLAPAARMDSGYRDYSAQDVEELRFVRTARDLGFTVVAIADLLGLWRDCGRRSQDVNKVAQAHIAALREKAARLAEMADRLEEMASACADDESASCSIISGLAGR